MHIVLNFQTKDEKNKAYFLTPDTRTHTHSPHLSQKIFKLRSSCYMYGRELSILIHSDYTVQNYFCLLSVLVPASGNTFVFSNKQPIPWGFGGQGS